MAAPGPPAWATTIDEADDLTAQLILKLQLEDIKALEDAAADSGDADQHAALRYFKAELEHHSALRSPSPPSTAVTAREATPDLQEYLPAPVALFDCVACGDRFDAEHCWRAPCEHHYCDADLGALFRASMTDEALYPPRCCRQAMPFEDVEFFLERDLAREFAAKKEELDDKKAGSAVYCHDAACMTFLGQAQKDGTRAECPECSGNTCVLCKEAYHDGDCVPNEAVQQLDTLAEQQGWKRCPDCRRMVELSVGCNHMTCLCRAQFCYVCGQRWKTCECPLFDAERLLHRGRQIADREGRADVAAVVEEVRQTHDCDGAHNFEFVPRGGRCEECRDHLPRFMFRCTRCRMLACRRCRDNVL